MKKFVAGVAVGALIFGTVPVFADSIKSLVGEKVTGVYTVEQGGKKIADGAVINGSAYVPVRAIADATGTNITVDGKTIKLGQSQKQEEEAASSNRMKEIEESLVKAKGELKRPEEAVPIYEEIVKREQEKIAAGEGSQGTLELSQRYLDEAKSRIVELEELISSLEKEREELLNKPE